MLATGVLLSLRLCLKRADFITHASVRSAALFVLTLSQTYSLHLLSHLALGGMCAQDWTLLIHCKLCMQILW